MTSASEVVPAILLVVLSIAIILVFIAWAITRKVDYLIWVTFFIGSISGLIYFTSVVISGDYTQTTYLYMYLRILFYTFMGISLLLVIIFTLSIDISKAFFATLIATVIIVLLLEIYWWNNLLPQLFLIGMMIYILVADLVNPNNMSSVYKRAKRQEDDAETPHMGAKIGLIGKKTGQDGSTGKSSRARSRTKMGHNSKLTVGAYIVMILAILSQLFLVLSKVWCPHLTSNIMLIAFYAIYTISFATRA
jgi:hypothetical protein